MSRTRDRSRGRRAPPRPGQAAPRARLRSDHAGEVEGGGRPGAHPQDGGRPGGGRVRLELPVAGRPHPAGEVDARRLAAELEAAIEGDVRFDEGHRAAYATDASNYRQVPIGVVMPRTKEDVERTVEACRGVITDGFSCRTQIEQNVEGVRPLNLAEVVWRALEARGDRTGPRQAFPPPVRERAETRRMDTGFSPGDPPGGGHRGRSSGTGRAGPGRSR